MANRPRCEKTVRSAPAAKRIAYSLQAIGVIFGALLIMFPCITRAAPQEGLLGYREGNIQTPRYRLWDNPTLLILAELSANTISATPKYVVVKECPTRNEMALGTQDDLGHVNVQIWDGETWGNLLEVTTLIKETAYRGFDMAYEQSSGDLVVAYYNGTAGQISYRRWNGAWQAAQTYNAPIAGGTILWIKMAALPGTDNIVMGMVNNTPRTMATTWNGATNTFAVGSGLGAANSVGQASDIAKFDVDYEQLSGNPVIVYADTDNASRDLEFWRYSGGAWAKPASQPNDADEIVAAIRIASCAGTNYIGVINLDTLKNIDVHTWNGTTALWTTGREGGVAGCGNNGECEVTDLANDTSSEPIDIAFEQMSCDGLAVYGLSNQDAPAYRTWTLAGGWSTAANSLDPDISDAADPRVLKLIPKTGSNEIMMMVLNKNKRLGGERWSGAAPWNQINAGAAMETDTGSDVSWGFDFDYHWPPTITVGKAGTQTGYVRAAETNLHIGTFTLSTPGTKYGKITQIIVSETGTIAANTKLSDVRLYVDDDGVWNGGGDETQISGPKTFSAGQTVTFNVLNLWTNTPIYLYVEADLAGGVTGETIQYSINASGDVTSPNAYITGPAVTFDAKTVDADVPTVTIVGPAAGSWQRANFVVDVTNADTGGSGLNVCSYQVASSGTYYLGWTPYDCATDPTITVGAGLNCRDEGANMCQVEFYNTDIAGNTGTTQTRLFSIDWTAPTFTVTDGANPVWNNSDTIAVTVSDTGGSGASATTNWGYSADATCNAADDPALTNTGLTTTVTTNHTDYVCFKNIDNAGNPGYSAAIGPLWVDASAPTVTINSPAPGSWWNANFTADVTNADTGGSGLNQCFYRVLSNAVQTLGWTAYTCATDPTITVGVAPANCRDEGANKCQVEFYDTDIAGNTGTTRTRQFSITFGAITPVTPSWTFSVVPATPFYGSGAPATNPLGEKVLYIGNSNGKLYAVRISDGVKMWEYNTGSDIRSTPYFRDYVLYFGAENGTLYAVRDNGLSPSLEWSQAVSPGFPIRTSVVRWLNGTEGRLYFGSANGYLYCRQAATPGNVCAGPWPAPNLGSAIYSTPAIPGDGYVYVGTSGGIIAKVDRSSGGVLSTYLDYTGVYGSPFVYPQPIAGSWLWIGAYSNAVYKVDTTQPVGAEKIWPSFSPSSAGDFQGGVFVDVWRGGAWGSKTVYAGNDNGCLYAITDLGAQKWKYPAGADSLSYPIASCPMLDPNTNKIYFGADDFNIYALLDDPAAPTMISGWPFSTGGAIKACPSMSPGPGGKVMIPSTDGNVYAFPR